MISKSLAIKVLNAALATGGDYAEIYLEETVTDTVSLENGKVDSCGGRQGYGAGIRILKGFRSVYGFTSDLHAKNLIELATTLSNAYEGERLITVDNVKKQHVKVINKMSGHYADVPTEKKIAYLKECYEITKGVDDRLVRIVDAFSSVRKNIEIFIAEGNVAKQINAVEERGRLTMVAVAAGSDGQIQNAFAGPARCDGFEYFTNVLDYKKKAKELGEKAIALLSAKECPSGKFPVVITNGWGGVLFHEACGHPLEASATAKGLSVFSDIDSEGVPTKKNMLIKNGICVGYMVDRTNGRRLGMEPNGTSRRQSYKYEPTSRMSNTYIAAGKDDPEQIIKDTKLGIYVADFGGGSVEPTTGDFNFSASEAYIIRDGKLCEMLKGCTLIGNSSEILMNIDRVGNDLAFGNGMCGASSGYIPVNVGQPTIRLKEITVGGRGGKLE